MSIGNPSAEHSARVDEQLRTAYDLLAVAQREANRYDGRTRAGRAANAVVSEMARAVQMLHVGVRPVPIVRRGRR